MLYIYILVDKERIKIEAIVSMKILIEALKDVNRMSISLFFAGLLVRKHQQQHHL